MKTRLVAALAVSIVLVVGIVLGVVFLAGGDYKPLTQTNFASSISKASAGVKSLHFAMTGARLSVSADFSFVDAAAMQMTMSANVDGKDQTLNTKIVGGSAYMQVPPSKWVALGSSGTSSTVNQQYKNLGPQGLASQFESGVKSVKYVGQVKIKGQSVRQYTVVVDSAQLGSSLTSLANSVPAFKNMKTVTEQVYLSDKNMLQRWEITLPAPVGSVTIDFSKWNAPVKIAAPAATEVQPATVAPTPTPSPSATSAP